MSLSEKLFFTQYVPMGFLNVVVDYGCGDGSLLKEVAPTTQAALLGIERDERQVYLAAANLRRNQLLGTRAIIRGSATLDGLVKTFAHRPNSLLILSSVMHEQQDPIGTFQELLKAAPRYIAFRDFAWHGGLTSDLLIPLVRRYGPTGGARDWLNAYLHSKWPEDSPTEDYFGTTAWSWEQAMLADGKYRPLVLRKVLPGWLDAELRKDFPGCIPSGFTTHMEVVLERIP